MRTKAERIEKALLTAEERSLYEARAIAIGEELDALAPRIVLMEKAYEEAGDETDEQRALQHKLNMQLQAMRWLWRSLSALEDAASWLGRVKL